MKKLVSVLIIFISINAVASEGLVLLDAYEICSNLRAYTRIGSAINSYDVKSCIRAINGNQFSLDAANLCLQLPRVTSIDYYIAANEVTSCFKTIANKEYSDSQINYCRQIRRINAMNGYSTTSSDVLDCLK